MAEGQPVETNGNAEEKTTETESASITFGAKT